MAIIRCPECGKEFEDSSRACPECGCPIMQQTKTSIDNRSLIPDFMRTIRNFLFAGAIICFIFASGFYCKAYNVKNDYYNSEDYPTLNKNAYVGGDAYNYIINGTYFTGYVSIASDMVLGGIVFLCNAAIVAVKIKGEERSN